MGETVCHCGGDGDYGNNDIIEGRNNDNIDDDKDDNNDKVVIC